MHLAIVGRRKETQSIAKQGYIFNRSNSPSQLHCREVFSTISVPHMMSKYYSSSILKHDYLIEKEVKQALQRTRSTIEHADTAVDVFR
jgi:hypothetical protein